jgi:hypothetical protein
VGPDLAPMSSVWVALHVFAIAFAQLHLYVRFDFVAMLTTRLVYYAVWHVVWGTIRAGT